MKHVLLLITLLLKPVSALTGEITLIELGQRPAEEIIPILQPLLDKDASISGQGFTLFVRTSEENLEQIKSLIIKLDTAAKQLLISVFQGNDQELHALELDAGVAYDDGYSDLQTGQPMTGGGGSVEYSTNDARLNARVLRTRAHHSDQPVHSVRVTEGSEAYIETGQSIPYFSSAGYGTPQDPALGAHVEFKDVTTGFYVFPRLHGDQVTLAISPFKGSPSRAQADTINSQRVTTTVTGDLGQWLQIGGVNQRARSTVSGIGHYASTRDRQAAGIWIKAELAQ